MLVLNRPKIVHISNEELQKESNKNVSNNKALKQYDYFVSKEEKLPKRKKVC